MPKKVCKIYAVLFTLLFVFSALMTGTLAYTAVSEKVNEISGTNNPSPRPEYVSVQGEKIWENLPQDYTLPPYIIIHILADGEIYRTMRVKESNDWKYTADALPKYNQQGEEILYTVDEEPLNGFFTRIDGYQIINHYIPQSAPTSIHVKKIWENDSSKNRPTSVELRLLADGQEMERVTLTEAINWEYTWTNLDSSHEYTVDEPVVPDGYTSETKQTALSDFEIVNTFGEPEPSTPQTVTISGRKIWNHGIAPAYAQPAAVTVYIKNGDTIMKELLITANDNWSYSVTLPRFDQNHQEIHYTIDEKNIPNYEKIIDNYNIINTYIPKTPINPNNPTQPSQPGQPTTTGDNMNILLWLLVMILSGLSSALFIIRYHKVK